MSIIYICDVIYIYICIITIYIYYCYDSWLWLFYYYYYDYDYIVCIYIYVMLYTSYYISYKCKWYCTVFAYHIYIYTCTYVQAKKYMGRASRIGRVKNWAYSLCLHHFRITRWYMMVIETRSPIGGCHQQRFCIMI